MGAKPPSIIFNRVRGNITEQFWDRNCGHFHQQIWFIILTQIPIFEHWNARTIFLILRNCGIMIKNIELYCFLKKKAHWVHSFIFFDKKSIILVFSAKAFHEKFLSFILWVPLRKKFPFKLGFNRQWNRKTRLGKTPIKYKKISPVQLMGGS